MKVLKGVSNMRYSIYTGVEHQQNKFKILLIAAFAAIGMVVVAAVPALASGSGYCIESSNGCEAAQNAGAQCDSGAGSGAFGAFSDPSQHGSPSSGQPPYFGDDELGSARGGTTGANNSAVCGNPQN